MFDNPRKSLRQMEQALQAAEAEEASARLLEEFAREEDADFDYDGPSHLRKEDDTFQRAYYSDEVLSENAAVFVEKKKRKKKEKKKKTGCLPLVLLLELGAIGLVLWGWYLCLK